jgi:hypothetical protein
VGELDRTETINSTRRVASYGDVGTLDRPASRQEIVKALAKR